MDGLDGGELGDACVHHHHEERDEKVGPAPEDEVGLFAQLAESGEKNREKYMIFI